MAKFGNGIGATMPAAAAPAMNPGSLAPMASPRPMARGMTRAMPRGQVETGGLFPDIFRRGEGGILPERGSQAQRDAVASLAQAGMASAAQSGSPLLALLAPLMGGAAMTRAEGLYQGAQKQAGDAALDDFITKTGGGDKARVLLDMMNDENLPDAAKSVLKDQFADIYEAMGAPAGGGSGRRSSPGRRATGTPSAIKDKLYGEFEVDGVLYGRDRYGNIKPYTGPDGLPFRVGGAPAGGGAAAPAAGAPAAPATPAAPPPVPQSMPSLPADPPRPPASAAAAGAAQPQSKEDYDALPSGTRFVDPEGTVRIKP